MSALTMEETKKRFYARIKVTKSGCHEWTGYTNVDGYGRSHFNGKQTGAHRVGWILVNGEIPNGLSILHKCDNPPCVNPEHLLLGTQTENVLDMAAKKRDANSKKTHCPKGHPYDEINTKISIRKSSRLQLNRQCITCRVEYKAQYAKDNREWIKEKRFAKREEMIEYLRRYREKNREKLKLQKSEFYYANREEILKIKRLQYQDKKGMKGA